MPPAIPQDRGQSPSAPEDRQARHFDLGLIALFNPSQQQLAILLREKIDAKLAELDRTLKVWREDGAASARAIVMSDEGKVLMDDVRALVARMEAAEYALLAARSDESRRSSERAGWVFAGSAFGLVGLVAVFFLYIRRGVGVRMPLLHAERASRGRAERALANEQDARKELEHANQIKDQFLATVSHELRTPLNAMFGWARMLRLGVDPPMFERALDSIERNAKAQARLIEDLLDVSRIIAGKMRLEVRPIDVRVVVRQAADVVRPAADAKEIRLDVVLSDQPSWVSGDAARLQQAVWNLISNAVKFTPKQGRVRVRCETVDSHVAITVSDNGEGMPPDFLPHVFEPFRQADGTPTRLHGGLGLGLAIVRNLVELQGGTVAAASEGIGRGAPFTIKLPVLAVRDSAAAARGGVRPEATLPVLSALRVIVVDDQPDTLEMVAAVLVTCGAEVRACPDAAQALQAVETWNPDILIADVAMPNEDGYSLIRKVRALDTASHRLPAIALTARAYLEDKAEALAAGFQVHVSKPVEPAELASLVASLCGRETA